ncbi:MAG: hypothetical protein IMZ54_11740 [Acidobacteria bacterium]|nr:hypothetical protein [Acidobacteriota bacterium]
MSWPTDPKSLQVIDRIVEVLNDIVGGGPAYFHTPGGAIKGFVHYSTVTKFPYYMVAFEGASERPVPMGDNQYHQTLAVSIKGWVDLEKGESVSKLLRCIRDVQKAVNEDTKSGAGADSLGVLACQCDIDTTEADSGFLAIEGRGFGYFDQRVVVVIEGDWGEL